LRQRADFLAVRQSEVPLRVLAQQAELDLKPRVDLSVRGGYAGLNRGHSVIEPLTQRLTGANGELGVMLEWPGANTYQRGLLRSRRAAQRQAELTTAQFQSDIAADVCTALAEVRLRAETMRNAGATAAIARKAVEQEQRRLQTGEATVLDVINLENLMSSARLSQIDAQAGYAVAVARLRYAVGEIFLAENRDQSFQLTDLTQLPADEK
jgi:outer membrane protein TolC